VPIVTQDIIKIGVSGSSYHGSAMHAQNQHFIDFRGCKLLNSLERFFKFPSFETAFLPALSDKDKNANRLPLSDRMTPRGIPNCRVS
jgi:hypothetical protein